jgi:hypothetical protein
MKKLIAGAVLAAALAVTAVVQAGIPDGSGVIHGCYKANQGTLRVIDTAQGQACTNGENGLNWTQTAPSYSAGAGLALDGSTDTFSVSGGYQLPQSCSPGQSPFFLGFPLTHPWSCFTAANAGESCASSKFVDGIDANGDVTCSSPAGGGGSGGSSGSDVWVARNLGIQIDTPQDQDTTLATLSLPAGTFLLEATGDAADDPGGDGRVQMQCTFSVGTNYENIWVDDGNAPHVPFTLHDVVTLDSATDVNLGCFDYYGSDHVANVIMTAEAVGSIH